MCVSRGNTFFTCTRITLIFFVFILDQKVHIILHIAIFIRHFHLLINTEKPNIYVEVY